VASVDYEREHTVAERTNLTKALNSVDSSTWVVPGALLGAYILTRLPFGVMAGLALGFTAGWTLRTEYGATPRSRSYRLAGDQRSGVVQEDEKVDAMSDDSFPASDPPSYTPTRTGKPRKD
jgi:hypothetical protein